MQTETPPKQAAWARQVRQRMNRLGKPEHRARFCFFSKKKSPAGMRRFLLRRERAKKGIQPQRSQSPQPQKPKNPSPTAVLSRREAPPYPLELSPHNARYAGTLAGALRQPRPLKPLHLLPAPHHRAPRSHSYCAHAQGQSRVRACRTVREEHAAPATRGRKRKCCPNRRLGRGKCGKG